MKGFSRHVDHINWISRPENLHANVTRLEALTGLKMQHLDLTAFGFEMYMSWEGGVGVIAPTGEPSPSNQHLHDWLDERGEGVRSVIFGVADIESETDRLTALGFAVGKELNDAPGSPWHDKVSIRERPVTAIMNTAFTLGQIFYSDDVVKVL
ncbi:hypothetical protein OOT33_08015 [Sphingobium sp. DEHP117]|uniref:hypothetical protein n=1 Tax=Sphingobium sp. DEHP117 TaxID=2993436 RepID=UPI0027D50CAA|nr:hypothetical protein [Sphingobium sp. DEHP117]MDQ4420378.1 hypothetical protein [Sphingobium sp. DEHP117]